MGYFSNGSEGECYEEHYCSRCVHAPVPSLQDMIVATCKMLADHEKDCINCKVGTQCPRDYEKGDCCPILTLHSMWNYEQFDDSKSSKEKSAILDSFIPREGTRNGQCKMFVLMEGK